MPGDVLVRELGAQSVQRGILILSNPSQPKYKNEHSSPASTSSSHYNVTPSKNNTENVSNASSCEEGH